MTEKVTTYVSMLVLLALIVKHPDVISRTVTQFAAGVSGIAKGIVG